LRLFFSLFFVKKVLGFFVLHVQPDGARLKPFLLVLIVAIVRNAEGIIRRGLPSQPVVFRQYFCESTVCVLSLFHEILLGMTAFSGREEPYRYLYSRAR